ncbi:MAG: pitrilysin family protein [Gemmatimonadota bacterium]
MIQLPVDRVELDNGLTVILSHDPSLPVAAVNLWYAVGSRNEPEGKTGYAHLFEHMMFQGSANVPKGRHFELLERAGGSVNATTWFDRTNYFETVPSHHLELALWLEADRMGGFLQALTLETLENQRSVVKNERKQRYDNQPYGDWDERLQALLFPPGHPYRHSVIGSMEDLDRATLDDVRSFFLTWYTPENAVLSVAGDLDRDRTMGWIRDYFGTIPARGQPPEPRVPVLASVLGETIRQEVEAEVPLPRIYMGMRIPPLQDAGFPAIRILATVLGSGRSSRLYSKLVRESGVARDVMAFPYPLVGGCSTFLIQATGVSGTAVGLLEELLVDELAGVREVREEEVQRAVALADTGLVSGLQEVGTRADLLSMYQTLLGDAGEVNREMARLRAVTPGQVRDAADALLGEDNRAILTYRPASRVS